MANPMVGGPTARILDRSNSYSNCHVRLVRIYGMKWNPLIRRLNPNDNTSLTWSNLPNTLVAKCDKPLASIQTCLMSPPLPDRNEYLWATGGFGPGRCFPGAVATMYRSRTGQYVNVVGRWTRREEAEDLEDILWLLSRVHTHLLNRLSYYNILIQTHYPNLSQLS